MLDSVKYINTLEQYGAPSFGSESNFYTIPPESYLNPKNEGTTTDPEPEIVTVPLSKTDGNSIEMKMGGQSFALTNPNTKYFYSINPEDRPKFSMTPVNQDQGYRHNNPGNLRPYEGYTGKEQNGFRVFGSLESGWEALIHDFDIKRSGKSSVITPDATVRKYISIYAPNSENDTKAYIKYVQDNGIDIDKPIGNLSHDEELKLLKVIVKRESPNSYEYLFNPGVRNSVLSALMERNVNKSKSNRIFYKM